VPASPTGVPASPTGVPASPTGVPASPTGVPASPTGVPPPPTGVPALSTRVPAHASLHNLTYWRRGRYLGLGAGAHGFDGSVRSWNVAGVPAYLQAVREGRRPTDGEERLGPGQARFEALALRLRTVDGLGPGEARDLGVDPGGPEAGELRAAGLLAPGPGLRLTERGMFLHGLVVARLA
jgi:coproporphyrinogen III oxidase-like Fe-S oxidoreductase